MDADKLLSVLGARVITLPYFHARMKMKRQKDFLYFESNRKSHREAAFKGRYKPISKPYYPEIQSLSYWLLERYVLWTYKHGALYRGIFIIRLGKSKMQKFSLKKKICCPSLLIRIIKCSSFNILRTNAFLFGPFGR